MNNDIPDRHVLTVTKIIELGYIRNARDRRELTDKLYVLKRDGDPDELIPKIEKLIGVREHKQNKQGDIRKWTIN